MAGDLDLKEQVVVLPEGADVLGAQAARTLQDSGGRVLHRYGPRVMVLEIPEDRAESVRGSLREAEFALEPSEIGDRFLQNLDLTGALGYEGMRLRQGGAFQEAKATRPLEGEDWDDPAADRPDAQFADEPPEDLEGDPSARGLFSTPTSAFLIGSVAVGLVIVEGPSEDLKFTEEERAKVVAEVQNGLSWLGSQEPKANLTWSYDIKVVSLGVTPGSPNLSGAQKERRWRDPAMAHLGFGTGMRGVRSYVQDLRNRLHTRWAYCTFFTKYPLGHFAYASIGGPRLVMHYGNDGWGVNNIDRVFVHETGHVFGAPDEYASSGCSCRGRWGKLRAPNGNCANCAEGGGVSCIMRSNSWTMCEYSRVHFGWRDQDNDGILDPDDPVQNPRWWLFRWLCRRFPQICRFLGEPVAEEEEDLVPMSLLAEVLSEEDLGRVEERVRSEQEAYLRAATRHMDEASEELRSVKP